MRVTPMKIEGNFGEDGFVIVRQLFDRAWVERMLPILDAAQATNAEMNPETGKPGGRQKSFFHVNNTKYFPPGSSELRELLESAADEQLHEVFELACGARPTFSHFSCWYEPEQDEAGGGWCVLCHVPPFCLAQPLPDNAGRCLRPARLRHRDMQYVFPNEVEEKERISSGQGYGSGNTRFSGIQVQCALLDGSAHIEYVPGSHARWDTEEEYAVRKADHFSHRFEPMPGAVRPVLQAGDAFAFTDGLHRGHYEAAVPRRTLMFTLSNGRRARGLDYFTFQPWFLEPGYLSGLSPRASTFYGRYLDEYGTEMREAAGLLREHPAGIVVAYREVRAMINASNSLSKNVRAWHAQMVQKRGSRAHL